MPIMPPAADGSGSLTQNGGAMPPAAGSQGPPPADEGPRPSRHPAPGGGAIDEKQLEQFVDGGRQAIYGGKTESGELSQGAATLLRKGANDPVGALAMTAAHIAAAVITSAMDKNISLDPAVALAGLMEIVEELGTAASMEGIYDYDQDEMNAAATQAGEKMYALTQETGLFPQEEAIMESEGIVKASESGEMDQAISQLEQAERQAGQEPPAGGSPIMDRGGQ